jgi:hypothetical protein
VAAAAGAFALQPRHMCVDGGVLVNDAASGTDFALSIGIDDNDDDDDDDVDDMLFTDEYVDSLEHAADLRLSAYAPTLLPMMEPESP